MMDSSMNSLVPLLLAALAAAGAGYLIVRFVAVQFCPPKWAALIAFFVIGGISVAMGELGIISGGIAAMVCLLIDLVRLSRTKE